MRTMRAFASGFAEELIKCGGVGELVERAIGAKGSPLRKAIGRGAALGAGTETLQTALEPTEKDRHGKKESKHYVRNAVSGALAGGATGRVFPSWFGRKAMIPDE